MRVSLSRRGSLISRQWLVLAVASLIIAGLQSLLLVIGRLPFLSTVFDDPLFFRRALVVHVNLALLVWFYAFLMALYFALPSAHRVRRGSAVAPTLAALGVLAIIGAASVPGAVPVLSNYVPFIDHPLFTGGLIAFGAGVVIGALDRRLLPANPARDSKLISSAPAAGIRAGVVALLLAALTFAASSAATLRDLPRDTYYELVAWAGGHVLQFANVAGMTAVWLVLLESALGRPPVAYRTASVLYALLILPLVAAPLVALEGPASRVFFTELMRWGIFPVVTVFIALCARAVLREARIRGAALLRDPDVLTFGASALLSVAGFVLGASIRGSSTLIPAHYHASIGAVTIGYMAITYRLLARHGMPVRGKLTRVAAVQPALFGAGQLVFALGFALAGAHGMARKAYGSEQHIRTFAESAGLLTMGLGGLIAISAGIAFLVIATHAWLTSRAQTPARARQGDSTWTQESIRSRG